MNQKNALDSIVVLGNLVLTCARTDSTAYLVFERASSDFTCPASSTDKAAYHASRTAAAVTVSRPAQGPGQMRVESRRRCL